MTVNAASQDSCVEDFYCVMQDLMQGDYTREDFPTAGMPT